MSAPKRARPTFEFPYPLLDPRTTTLEEQTDAMLSDLEFAQTITLLLPKKMQKLVDTRLSAVHEQVLGTLDAETGRFNIRNEQRVAAEQTLNSGLLDTTGYIWDTGSVGQRAQTWRTFFTAFSLIADATGEKVKKEEVVANNIEAYGTLLTDLIALYNRRVATYVHPTSMPSILDEIEDLLTKLLNPVPGMTLLDTFLQLAINYNTVKTLAEAQDTLDRTRGAFVSAINRPWLERKYAEFKTVAVQFQLGKTLIEMYQKVNENLRAMHSIVLPYDVMHRQFGPRIVTNAIQRTEMLQSIPSRTSAIARWDAVTAANNVFFAWIGDMYKEISLSDRVQYSIFTEFV